MRIERIEIDGFGRFHITCAVTPHEGRGSNFVLKLDDRTLPSGYRASGNQVRIKRATRGKALRFNFGASIHRVIGLDIADAVRLARAAQPDMRIEVDLAARQLHVYRGEERTATHPVAVGSSEWPTPTGEWDIGQVIFHGGNDAGPVGQIRAG